HELTHVVQQAGGIRHKLVMGAPGDVYEQEANQISQAVMRVIASGGLGQTAVADHDGRAHVQRRCAHCDQELGQPMEEEEEQPELQVQKAPDGAPYVRRLCDDCERDLQRQPGEEDQEQELQTHKAHGDKGFSGLNTPLSSIRGGDRTLLKCAQPVPVRQRLSAQRVQGTWTLSGATDFTTTGVGDTRLNGWETRTTLANGVRGSVYTQQSKPRWEWCITGGSASMWIWKATQYTFTHDGRDTNFLEFAVSGDLSGSAKAEDLHFAKSGAVVVGLYKVRTPASPTPAAMGLFTIKDGGKSSAQVGSIADIEASIPIDGTITVRIPLTAVGEGDLASFSESLTPPVSHDERGTIGSQTVVDVYLAARVEAAADVESTCSLFEGTFDDVNRANAVGTYQLVRWRDRPAPAVVTPGEGTSAPEGGAGVAGAGGAAAPSRHQVRLQLQAGSRELTPSEIVTETRPVTASEGVRAVDRLIDRAQARHYHACRNAANQMQSTIRGFPPTGVARLGHIMSKMCNRDVTEGGYRLRIDLNNDAGHNFQT
ncbi:MAG TPA: hypothetical protein VF897_23655, partial [Roseiflexaceae bacterium]